MLFDRTDRSMQELTADLDQTAHGVAWLPDSQSVVFMSEHRGTDQLFRIRLQDRGQLRFLVEQLRLESDRRVAGGESAAGAIHRACCEPKELSLLSLERWSVRRISHINDALIGELELPTVTERWVAGKRRQADPLLGDLPARL